MRTQSRVDRSLPPAPSSRQWELSRDAVRWIFPLEPCPPGMDPHPPALFSAAGKGAGAQTPVAGPLTTPSLTMALAPTPIAAPAARPYAGAPLGGARPPQGARDGAYGWRAGLAGGCERGCPLGPLLRIFGRCQRTVRLPSGFRQFDVRAMSTPRQPPGTPLAYYGLGRVDEVPPKCAQPPIPKHSGGWQGGQDGAAPEGASIRPIEIGHLPPKGEWVTGRTEDGGGQVGTGETP